jgi:hypothetical protein
MNDDRMDEVLGDAVRDYNAPGAVPREEMWRRIQAARGEPRRASVPAPSRSRWLWPGVGGAVAAAAVLVIGILLGRRIERVDQGRITSPTKVAATTPSVAPTADSGTDRASDSAAAAGRRDSLIERIHEQTKATDRHARQLELASRDSNDGNRAASRERDDESMRLAYRLVMLQHMAGSEAMITAFRASARRGDVDAQMARWARELLGTTRLLESSPASADPTMRRMLQDLDLVIAQIVQYASHGTTNPEELDLIERSIQTRGIMAKLRGTTPTLGRTAGT